MSDEMTDAHLRLEALRFAVGGEWDSSEDIVSVAEQYYQFLKGEKEEKFSHDTGEIVGHTADGYV